MNLSRRKPWVLPVHFHVACSRELPGGLFATTQIFASLTVESRNKVTVFFKVDGLRGWWLCLGLHCKRIILNIPKIHDQKWSLQCASCLGLLSLCMCTGFLLGTSPKQAPGQSVWPFCSLWCAGNALTRLFSELGSQDYCKDHAS